MANTLITLKEFKKSGRCPVEPYHLIHYHKESLVKYGAIVRFGKRWMFDEPLFFDWIREFGATINYRKDALEDKMAGGRRKQKEENE